MNRQQRLMLTLTQMREALTRDGMPSTLLVMGV